MGFPFERSAAYKAMKTFGARSPSSLQDAYGYFARSGGNLLILFRLLPASPHTPPPDPLLPSLSFSLSLFLPRSYTLESFSSINVIAFNMQICRDD